MQSAYIQITAYMAKAIFVFFWISTAYPNQGLTNSGGARVLNKEFPTSEPQLIHVYI
jgi:hypothetical protein